MTRFKGPAEAESWTTRLWKRLSKAEEEVTNCQAVQATWKAWIMVIMVIMVIKIIMVNPGSNLSIGEVTLIITD